MARRTNETESDSMPRLYTIADVMRETGLSNASVSARIRSRADVLGPYTRIGVSYAFNAKQFNGLCQSWGRGQDAIRRHALIREARNRGLKARGVGRLKSA